MAENEQIYTYASKRTAAIYHTNNDKLIGSGFFISKYGEFITSAHLDIGEPISCYILDSKHQRFEVTNIIKYPNVDIALLRCKGADYRFDFFTVNTRLLIPGRSVYVFGFPDVEYYDDIYFRRTIIASKTSIRNSAGITLPVWGLDDREILIEGMSGGPVVDEITREVVGVIYGYDKTLAPHYNIRHEIEGSVLQKRDNFFIPFESIMSIVPELEHIAMVNSDTEHIKLLEKVIETLDLLGISSSLFGEENDSNFAVSAIATAGGVFRFEMLIGIAAGKRTNLTINEVRELYDKLFKYQTNNVKHTSKFCIVTENEYSNDVDTFAKSLSIEIIRAEDLFTKLIDFTQYLEHAKDGWLNDRKGIAKKFIGLRARKLEGTQFKSIASVEGYLDDWVKNSTKSQLLILGKYGSGKTTLLRYLFYKLAKSYVDNETDIAPILIRLGKARNSTIRRVIGDLLQDDLQTNGANLRIFSRLYELGKLLLLFDGFDEMSQPTRKQPAHSNLQELSRFLSGKSKTIITCRQEYFIGNDDIAKLLTVTEFDVMYNSKDFDVIILEDFDREQVQEYLSRVIPEADASRIYSIIQQKANLIEICQRPILLDMVTSIPSELETKTINLTNLYRDYINKWLDRDIIFERTDPTLLSRTDRLDLMRSIAIEMNRQGVISLDYDRLSAIMKKYYYGNLSKTLLHVHDILTNSFLARNDQDRQYEFAHRSFFEFFLAEALADQIKTLVANAENYRSSFGDRRLSFEVLNFIMEMGIMESDFWELIDKTRGKTVDEVRSLGGNAVTALRLLQARFTGRNFDNTILVGADFSDINLSESSFVGADLYDTGFSNAVLDHVDMTGSNLTRADLKSGKNIYGLAYSPSNNYVAIGSYSNKVSLYELTPSSYALQRVASFSGHTDNLLCVDISPSEILILSTGQEFNIRVWDIKKRREEGRLRGHLGDVWGAKFIDDITVVSSSFDGQIIKWDIQRYAPIQIVKSETNQEYWGMDISTQRDLLALGTAEGVIEIRSTANLELRYRVEPNQGQVRLVNFVPQERTILAGFANGNLFKWHLESNDQRIISTGKSAIKSLAVSNSIIATGHEDGSIYLWNKHTLEMVGSIQSAHLDAVGNLVFTTEESKLITTGHDGTIALWDLTSRYLLTRMKEDFENDQFNCKHLRLIDTHGLTKERLAHLCNQGAIVGRTQIDASLGQGKEQIMRQIEFTSHGDTLRGHFYLTSETPQNEPLVVMTTGDGKSGSKSGTYKAIIPKLIERGICVFIFDFAGKGYSDGDDSRLTIRRSIDNLVSAMEVIASEKWVDQSRIGMFGSSFGANVVISYLGNTKSHVKALALKSPACFYPEVYELWVGLDGIKKWQKENYNSETERYWDSYLEAFDHNVYMAAKSINAPSLITHGSADTDVPIIQSQRLALCLAGEVNFVVLDGVSHSYEENNALERASQLYGDWFKEKL